jgi:hypothetical protein
MARPTLVRRLGAATLLTTLALSTAACGSDSGSEAATGTDPSASGEETSTEEVESSGDLEELDATEFYPAVMGAMEEAGTMGFSVSTSGGPAATDVTGVMEYAGDTANLQASSTGAQSMDMVVLDKVLYMSGAGLPLPDGKTWFRVDLGDPDSLFGQIGRAMDPSLLFETMQDPKSFELVGSEEVDGVETNHYDIVIDTASYADALDMPAQMTSMLPDEIPMEMWVDGDDRPRKFLQEVEMPAMGGGEATTTTIEGSYFDFGADVTIEAPPAAEVADKIPGR